MSALDIPTSVNEIIHICGVIQQYINNSISSLSNVLMYLNLTIFINSTDLIWKNHLLVEPAVRREISAISNRNGAPHFLNRIEIFDIYSHELPNLFPVSTSNTTILQAPRG